METTLNTIETWILRITIFLVPLIFLPLFPNAFTTPKIIVLTVGLGLALIIHIIRIIALKKLDFKLGTFDLPVLLIIVATALASFIMTPNRMEAFFLPGSATIIIASGLVYFLINQQEQGEKKNILLTLILSGMFVALSAIAGSLGLFKMFHFLPSIVNDAGFAITENHLTTIVFLAVALLLAMTWAMSESDILYKVSLFTGSFVLTIAIVTSVFMILPGKAASPQMPNLQTSWYVLVDTIKESPVWGAGPGNYLTAFNRFRPLSYNMTPLWNVRFASANNFWFSFLTETGLAGMIGLIFLAVYLYRLFQQQQVTASVAALGLFLILSLVIGSSLVSILLFFVLLAVCAKVRPLQFNLLILAVPVLILIFVYFAFLVKSVSAEMLYKQGFDAINASNGKAAYDLFSIAIKQSPDVDRYHSSFAQLDLALANAIAKNPTGDKISDSERQSISTLIQQAIAESKAAVSLNTPRSGNWALLANTYQSIMSFAQGADQFALDSYNQAIALDPIDPSLRLSLGGIYYSLKNYDGAISAFRTAIAAKSDLANAHYNLAIAYRDKGDIDNAITEINNVLSLVAKDSQDYVVAQKELDALNAKKPAKQPSQGETLTTPAPTEKPVVKPPLTLPENAAPIIPVASPTPIASPVPTPTNIP